MATRVPRLEWTDPGVHPARRVATRVASAAIAVVAAIVLLVPLVEALRPTSSSAAVDHYEHGVRPTPTRVVDGGFAAAFPTSPDRSAHTGAFDGTPITGATYESDPDTGFRFLVTYLDLPAAALGHERDVVLATIGSTARSFGGTLRSSSDTVVDGHPRGDFVVALHDASFHGRVVVVGTRLYVYGVQTPPGHDLSFTRFVDSFSVSAD